MKLSATIDESILANMGDGVAAVDRRGEIVTFNAAAAGILGVDAETLPGRPFGEVFLVREGLDRFTQGMLDAVQDNRETGRTTRKSVEIEVGGKPRLLAMCTSPLRAAPGGGRPEGVVAVFADVTEIRELRAAERRLGEELEAQHAELRTAYRKIEEGNRNLTETLRRVQVIRATATAAVIAVFLAAGIYAWNSGAESAAPLAAPPLADEGAPVTVTVQARRLVSTLTTPGRLAPRAETKVASPVSGRVAELHVRYGDRVEAGQPLLNLDTSEAERERRALRARYIDAVERVEELADWENSRGVAAARRSLSRVERSLAREEHEAEQTALLLERGIIPAREHEAVAERVDGLRLDRESALQELAAAREQGGPRARETADLDHGDVTASLRALDEAIARAAVRAPAAGIVMAPPQATGPGGSEIVEGGEVKEGQLLLLIADTDALSVTGVVDEVDVTKLRPGQSLTVTGDAFPGIELAGKVAHVASQAIDAAGAAGPAAYRVVAALEDVTPAQRGRLRLGMSADLAVVTRDSPDALLIPLQAVRTAGGVSSVLVRDPASGEARRVEVEIGETTLDSVEILAGLKIGDVLLIGPR